jgi:hypothetical protein
MPARHEIARHLPELARAIGRSGSTIPYPWAGLSELVSRLPRQELPLIGYGSLLSQASAARTIKDTSAQRLPCLAFGCRRIFNYEMPLRVRERYGILPDSPARAALNVEITRDPRHFLNGVLTTVRVADLAALLEREFGYDLASVPCLSWNAGDFTSLSAAYILAAPEVAARSEWQVVRPDILPEPDYARLCEQGAHSISEEFAGVYRETTCLADKQTTLKMYKELPVCRNNINSQ